MSYLFHIALKASSAIAFLALVWNSGSIVDPPSQAQGAQSIVSNSGTSSLDNSTKISTSAARLPASYGKLPISFEVNHGQTDPSVQFLARGAGYTLFLTPGEAVLSLHAPHGNAAKQGALAVPRAHHSSAAKLASTTPRSTVRLQLIGANTASEAKGVDPLPGKSNYFVGNDPAKWLTDVPTYAKVRYSNVYPGIELVYYGNQEGRIEHDFVVAPGADPNAIAISLRDSDGVVPDQNGGLTLHTKSGDLTLRSPTVYQDIEGQRKTIPASYLLANNQIKFQLGSYDRNAPLVIDPVIQYTATFGGSAPDYANAIAVDGAGNAYVTGGTSSINFPVVHPFQGSTDRGSPPAFVSKINAAGTALLYSTYLGDSDWFIDVVGIAVDKNGRAHITGTTNGGLPTKNAYQPVYANANNGPEDWSDAFLTVLGSTGNSLVYSTYLGGTGMEIGDHGTAVAVDGSGNAYITGSSDSPDFPTLHSIQPQGTTFIAKFNSAGVLQYSSVFGARPNPQGNSPQPPQAIAVDASGSAYITGSTSITDIPITGNAFKNKCSGACAFVTKLRPSGDTVAYSTFVSSEFSQGTGIAVDSIGDAYIAGNTGPGFPAFKSGFQNTYRGGNDGFVAKLNSSGSGLIWSTYLGGGGDDFITGLAVDQYRQVYVIGWASSSNFPLKAPLQTYTGNATKPFQVFVATLASSLGSIVYYSTYLNTKAEFYNPPYSPRVTFAVDKALNVYIAGTTNGDIKPTPGALSTGTAGNPGGGVDIFVSKLVIMDDLALGLSASSSSVTHGGNLTYTIAVTSKGPDFGYNLRIDDPLPAGTTFVAHNAGGGTCTVPPVGSTGTLHCVLNQLEKGQTYTVTVTVKVNAVAGTTLSNTATTVSNMQDFVQSNNKGTLATKVL